MCFHGTVRTVFLSNHAYFLMGTGICVHDPRYLAVLDRSAYPLIDMFSCFFNFHGMVQGQDCAGYGNVKPDSPACKGTVRPVQWFYTGHGLKLLLRALHYMF